MYKRQLFTYPGDIDIKNGSTVDAFAEGEVSAAFSTRNDRPNEKGGHIYISDSVVKAIARYVENGDGPIPYSENQDGETRREPQGENIGIIAQTSEGVTPAVISIIRSKVTAEGDTAAIFARALSLIHILSVNRILVHIAPPSFTFSLSSLSPNKKALNTKART